MIISLIVLAFITICRVVLLVILLTLLKLVMLLIVMQLLIALYTGIRGRRLLTQSRFGVQASRGPNSCT